MSSSEDSTPPGEGGELPPGEAVPSEAPAVGACASDVSPAPDASPPALPAPAGAAPRAAVPLRRTTWLWLGLLALGFALDLKVSARGERTPVSAAVMTAAREHILRERKPGNLVVHSPLFTLGELAPLGDLQAKPDVPPAELRRTRRVWVIDLAADPMFMGRRSPAQTIPLGEGVALNVYEPSGDQPATLFDLVADIDRADLRIERPRGTITSRCTTPRGEGGRACPGEPDWLYLAPRSLSIEGKSADCVWAHPTTGGDLVFTLPPMPEPPPGRRLILSLASAMTDDAVRQTADGATVRTDVEQAGKVIGGVTLPNRVGWTRADITLTPNVPTELRVSTPRDGRRHHCLNARISEGKAEP